MNTLFTYIYIHTKHTCIHGYTVTHVGTHTHARIHTSAHTWIHRSLLNPPPPHTHTYLQEFAQWDGTLLSSSRRHLVDGVIHSILPSCGGGTGEEHTVLRTWQWWTLSHDKPDSGLHLTAVPPFFHQVMTRSVWRLPRWSGPWWDQCSVWQMSTHTHVRTHARLPAHPPARTHTQTHTHTRTLVSHCRIVNTPTEN